MPRTLVARRALAHPAWWIALALLAANDHLFKGAGVLPGALTGKLSDFAGLLVAPALLAALFAVRTHRGWLLSHLAVGLGFAAINVSPALARVVEAATLPTPFPWWITVDPTDLVALPMLAVSAVVFARWAARPVAVRPLLSRAAVALGGLACVATSPPPEQVEPWPTEPPPGWGVESLPQERGMFMLLNETTAQQLVTVRALRSGVDVNCGALTSGAVSPRLALAADLFDAPVVWSVEPDRGIPLVADAGGRACAVLLLDGAALSPRLLVASTARYAPRLLITGPDPSLSDRALRLTGGGDDAVLVDHPALFPPPIRGAIDPSPGCATAAPGAGLAWTLPSVTAGLVESHTVGADGCHAITLDGDRFYVCLPGVPFSLRPGELLEVRPIGGPGIWDGLLLLTDRGSVRITVGFDPNAVVPSASSGFLGGCIGHRDACDGFVQPAELYIGEDRLTAGDRFDLDRTRTLHIVRFEHATTVDAACDAYTSAGLRFEAVISDLQPIED